MVEKIKEVLHAGYSKRDTSHGTAGHLSRSNVTPITLERDTDTKNIPESNPKTLGVKSEKPEIKKKDKKEIPVSDIKRVRDYWQDKSGVVLLPCGKQDNMILELLRVVDLERVYDCIDKAFFQPKGQRSRGSHSRTCVCRPTSKRLNRASLKSILTRKRTQWLIRTDTRVQDTLTDEEWSGGGPMVRA